MCYEWALYAKCYMLVLCAMSGPYMLVLCAMSGPYMLSAMLYASAMCYEWALYAKC